MSEPPFPLGEGPPVDLLRPLLEDPDDQPARERLAAWLEGAKGPEWAAAVRSDAPISKALCEQIRAGLTWTTPTPMVKRGLPQVPEYCYLYRFQDRPALSADLARGVVNPGFLWCRKLYLGYNNSLEPAAVTALAQSPYTENLADLELDELYISPEQLEEILTLKGLTHLRLTGGYSEDWGGMGFTWPTLNDAHLEVLARNRTLKYLQLCHQALGPKHLPPLAHIPQVKLDY